MKASRKIFSAAAFSLGWLALVTAAALAWTAMVQVPAGATQAAVGTGGQTYYLTGLQGGSFVAIQIPNGQSASICFADPYGAPVGQFQTLAPAPSGPYSGPLPKPVQF